MKGVKDLLRFNALYKSVALVCIIRVLPFLYCAQAHAEEGEIIPSSAEAAPPATTGGRSGWLDDYSQPVGLTYSAQATVNTCYLWRGLCLGGLNIQPSASVGYGGLYVDMWWNIGSYGWTFPGFQKEVDLTFGFARWGLDVSALFVHNFNSGFFDFANYADHGNSLEVRLRYTVSSKLPLSFLWATRVTAADGYYNSNGDLCRAYSTYAELSYRQPLPFGLSVYGALGITPWRSIYTYYRRGFAVQNIEVRLRKDWSLHERCGLMLQGSLSINPSALAADKKSYQWDFTNPMEQSVNANLAVGVYLK